MGHAQRLTLADVRDVFHLISEVQELGDDPMVWRTHLVDGLRRLIRSKVAGDAEHRTGVSLADGGLCANVALGYDSPAQLAQQARKIAEGRFLNRDPGLPRIQRRVDDGAPFTVLREDNVDDMTWERSGHANENCSPFGIGHFLASYYPVPELNCGHYVTLSRPPGDKRLSERERKLVTLCHEELGRLLRAGARLAMDARAGMSRRQRQVLEGMMAGLSEKQVARELEISQTTVHKYVTALYRRFGVQGRAELMARMIRDTRRSALYPQLWLASTEAIDGVEPLHA